MKFNKKLKKGFTLVELIVVIAIVAILAAVSVVSYLAFINSANESADIQLVKQLNTAIQADQTLYGIRKTPTEMLNAMIDNGFVVENLTKTKSGCDIVWDSDSNRFALLRGEDTVYSEPSFKNQTYLQKSKITKLVDNEKEAQDATDLHYSIYLTEMFGDLASLEVKSGLDVGKNIIGEISYINTSEYVQHITIRTCSANTTLIINDESTGSVHHYDSLGALNIVKCHTSSYHEYGNVAFAEVSRGRIELEKGSNIQHIHINRNTVSSFDTVIITDNGASELPQKITRDVVTVTEQTPVVTVESNGTSETVYVYADGTTGTTEQTNTQNADVSSDLGVLVLDNGEPGENALTPDEKSEEKESVIADAVDSEIVENNENYIARIGDTCYEDIHEAFDALQAGETLRLLKDYRVEQDSIIHVKTILDEADTAFGNLSADKIFDGCNHTIEFADGVSAYLFGDMNGTIQNFRVLNSTSPIAEISKTYASNHPITFKNIEIYGDMNVDGNAGAFVVFITGQNGEFRFIDCVNNCNMTGIGTRTDYNAAFIGYFLGIYGCEVYLTRCINNANVVCGAAAFIGGNPNLSDAKKTTARVYLTDCENRGKIQSTYTGKDAFTQNILYGAVQSWYYVSTTIDGRTYSMSDILNGLVPDTAIRGNMHIFGPVDSTLSLTRNNDGTFSFHGLDGAAKYEVSVGLYVRTVSGTNRYYAKQVINHIENQMDYDANIKDLQFVDYDWVNAHGGAIISIPTWNEEVRIVIYNEQQYFLVPEEYKINGGVTSGQMYTVVAYDSNNNLLASATLEN